MFPKTLYQFPQSAGKPFKPSNGTEGEIWMEKFCYQCIHERWSHHQNEDGGKCEILTNGLIGEQPKEWMFSENGWPVCTEWKFFDWGNDKDGFNEPPPPEPYDPNQLVFPFIIDEICEIRQEVFEDFS